MLLRGGTPARLSTLLLLTFLALSRGASASAPESESESLESESSESPDSGEYESPADALQEYLLCRQCGRNIADTYHFEYHQSPSSTVYRNITIFGKTGVNVQALTNPIGIEFKVVTAAKALCSGIGEWVRADSWFPGSLWKFCVCPHCSSHLGWLFESSSTATADRSKASSHGFYALIIDSIVGEKFVNSLMVLPNIFRS